MINVIHVLASSRLYGGAENVAINLQDNLSDDLLKIKTFTIKSGDLSDKNKIDNVGGCVFSFDFIKSVLKSNVILASDRSAVLLSFIIGTLFRKKVVGVIHGESKSKLSKYVMSVVWGKLHNVVFVTEQLKEKYNKDYGTKQKSSVIYNSCNESVFKNNNAKPKEITDFVFCGRLENEKNVTSLVSAFGKLKCDKLKLHVIGKGSLHDELVSSSMGDKSIVFHGALNQKEIKELYDSCDVFILPSFYEGCSISLLEAMQTGLLSMTSNAHGNVETLSDSGIYFNTDEDAIKSAIEDILKSSHDYVIETRNNQHARYKKMFSSDTMMKSYKEILNG